MKKELTQNRLKDLLDYDKETGLFTWKVPRGNTAKGSIAGTQNNGYIKITVDGKKYFSHRLAWLYMFGEWPKDQIDHENHIRDDNRLINLCEATPQENNKNRSMSKRNTSGVVGVYWSKRDKKWNAYIRINEKQKNLGLFKDKQEAIKARKTAEKEYGFHPNHGKSA